MKNLTDMLTQFQDMQSRMGDMQAALEDVLVEGQSGAGMVRVALSGKGEMKKVSIDPSLFAAEEKAVVEDLIVAAFNDAKTKVEARVQEEMAKLQSGLGLPPGLKLPF